MYWPLDMSGYCILEIWLVEIEKWWEYKTHIGFQRLGTNKEVKCFINVVSLNTCQNDHILYMLDYMIILLKLLLLVLFIFNAATKNLNFLMRLHYIFIGQHC